MPASRKWKAGVYYLTRGMPRIEFMDSLDRMREYDVITHGGGDRARIVGEVHSRSGANLAGPRNDLVRTFLAQDAADWLLMLDDDMVFGPDLAERLFDHADPVKAPIVGGLCFTLDSTGHVQPTLFGLMADDETGEPVTVRYQTWEPDAMFQVHATGTACLLIHRSVFERMAGRFSAAYPWFQETEFDARPVGEDITFCMRAGLLAIPVFVNTAVHVGHIKETVLTAATYFADQYLIDQAAHAAEPEGASDELSGA